MKRILFLIFLVGSFQYTYAQQSVIDSLEAEIDQIQDCRTKSEKYQEISENHFALNKEVLKYFIERGIEHNKACKDTIALGRVLLEQCVLYNNLSRADSALIILAEAERLFQKVNYTQKDCYLLKQYANCYSAKSDFAKAIEINIKALKCFEESSDKYTQNNTRRIKLNIGICYSKLREPKKAEKYWRDLYSDSLIRIDKRLYESVTINLCLVYRSLGRFKEAIKYGLLAANASKTPQTLSKVYGNLGTVYGASKQYDKSYEYMMKSLNLQRELKDSAHMQQTYHNLGYLFKLQGKYDEAIKYYLIANEELKKRSDLSLLRRSYQEISNLYIAKNDHKRALKYLKLENQIKDSIFGIEKIKAISDSEAKFETEKNQREREKAESEAKISKLKSRQNWNLFLAALLLVGLILVSSFFYFGRMRAKKKVDLANVELKEAQKRLELEKKTRVSQLKALKAQMNPHFIFNALNSIQDYILSSKTSKASQYLVKFAELIRNYLNFSDSGSISLDEEVNNLQLYLELEKSRFGEKLDFSINTDAAIIPEDLEIPTMIIQPYVENALVHGLFHKETDQKLTVHFELYSEDVLQCVVEDNGIGRKESGILNESRGKKHKSFATKANSSRLELFNENYANKLEVEMIDLLDKDKPAGTRVVIKMPILNSLE